MACVWLVGVIPAVITGFVVKIIKKKVNVWVLCVFFLFFLIYLHIKWHFPFCRYTY